MQVLGQAIEGVGSLDQKKLADYLRSHTFHTVAGDIKFGPNGEWTEPRVLAVQFRGVAGHDLDQFRDAKTEVVLWPPALQTGTLQSPYEDGEALTMLAMRLSRSVGKLEPNRDRGRKA